MRGFRGGGEGFFGGEVGDYGVAGEGAADEVIVCGEEGVGLSFVFGVCVCVAGRGAGFGGGAGWFLGRDSAGGDGGCSGAFESGAWFCGWA